MINKSASTIDDSCTIYTQHKMRKDGFTLAEVLIVIGVIGVVSALSLPTLIKTIGSKFEGYQKDVMTNKIVAGLNMYNHEDYGMVKTYNNTEEFVRGLSKHLKMVQICGKDNLTDCMPYDKINYTSGSGETKSVDVSSITSAKSLKLKGNWLDPAGFILANGTPFIISFNNDCAGSKDDFGRDIVDVGKPLTSIPTTCIDGLYDKNGAKPFNTYGKDIQPLFAAKIGSSCLLEHSDGTCLVSTPAVVPPAIKPSVYCDTNNQVKPEYKKLGIKYCCTHEGCINNGDRWAGAVKMCADQGMRLPKEEELYKLAQYLYNYDGGSYTDKIGSAYGKGTGLDDTKIPESLFGIGSSWHDLWSGSEGSAGYAYYRDFFSSSSDRDNNVRYVSGPRAVCVGDD